jgi:hypothetical protein
MWMLRPLHFFMLFVEYPCCRRISETHHPELYRREFGIRA